MERERTFWKKGEDESMRTRREDKERVPKYEIG
jgi:hypothetical protein